MDENPFDDVFFKWQESVKNRGSNVITVVSRGGSGLPLVAGDLDAMKNTLRTLARADGLGGCDFRQVAAHVVEDLEVEVKIIHVIL